MTKSPRGDVISALSCNDVQQRVRALQEIQDLLQSLRESIPEDWKPGNRGQQLFEGLAESAMTEGLAGMVGSCFFFYGRYFKAFGEVWHWLLKHLSSSAPFARLRPLVGVIRQIIDLDKESEALQDDSGRVLNALLRFLESTRHFELLPELLPIFSKLAIKYPAEFSSFFQDVVDLLLGLSVEENMSDDYRAFICETFASFGDQWQNNSHHSFAVSLQNKLSKDMQKIASRSKWLEDGRRLHALLQCFFGISKAMDNLAEIYDSAMVVLLQCINFFLCHLNDVPCSDGLAVRGIRICANIHLVFLEAAANTVDIATVEQLLQKASFRFLRVFLDTEVRRLLARTYLVLFLKCGQRAQEVVLQLVCSELQQLASFIRLTGESLEIEHVEPRGETEKTMPELLRSLTQKEMQVLSAFDFALLRHFPQTPALYQEAMAKDPENQCVLLICMWDAASRGVKEGSQIALDDFVPQLCGVLTKKSSLLLLQRVIEAPLVVWKCLSTSSQKELLKQVWTSSKSIICISLDLALAVCPLNFRDLGLDSYATFIESIKPYLPDLLDVSASRDQDTALHDEIAKKQVDLRTHLHFLCAPLGEHSISQNADDDPSRTLPVATHLRSLLATAPPMGGNALLSFLSSLRDADGRMNFDALFWATTSAPMDAPVGCRPLWLLLQAAAFFVRNRLKSPIGSASASLQFLESLLGDALSAADLNIQKFLHSAAQSTQKQVEIYDQGFRPLACVQLVHMLEQLILLAQEPVYIQVVRPQAQLHGKTTCQFYCNDQNQRVCGDWFQRMRGVTRQILARFGSHFAHYTVSLARLSDLLRQLVPDSGGTPLSLMVLDSLAPKGPAKRNGSGTTNGTLLTGAAWTKFPEVIDGVVDVGVTENNSKIMGLEHTLVPLLTSALALRNTGLVRGVFALYGHAAYALGGQALGFCQDAFLAFASQQYELASSLFAKRVVAASKPWSQAARWLASDTGPRSSEGGLGSKALQALIARAWLESSILSRDHVGVEQWTRIYESSPCVSAAMRAYAMSYLQLLRMDFERCDSALSCALRVAANECVQTDAPSDRASAQMQSNVCRLSRWSDLSNVFLIEASMASRVPGDSTGDSSRTVRALRNARACLQSDIAARSYFEPSLQLSGQDACEQNAGPLEMLRDLEASLHDNKTSRKFEPRLRAMGLEELHCAAVFDFPVFRSDEVRFRLVQHCVTTKNLRVASWLLGGMDASDSSDVSAHGVQKVLHMSSLFDAQQRIPDAFQVVQQKLLLVTQATVDAKATSEDGSNVSELKKRFATLLTAYVKFLGSRGADLQMQWAQNGSAERSSLSEALVTVSESILSVLKIEQFQQSQGPFTQDIVDRWNRALKKNCNMEARGFPEPVFSSCNGASNLARRNGCLNLQHLGWLSFQGCLMCPDDAQLWTQYGDWLFTQRSSLDIGQVEQVVVQVLEADVIASRGEAFAEEFRVLCRIVRESVRAWMHGRHDGNGPVSLEWLSDKTSVRAGGLWQAMGSASQSHLVDSLLELCDCLRQWETTVSKECLRAYVQNLRLEGESMSAHPKTQKTLLRIFRILAQAEENAECPTSLCSVLRDPSSRLPAQLWEDLVPQLLAYMRHPSKSASIVASELVTEVARASPHLIVFPALTAEMPGGMKDTEMQRLRVTPLQIISKLHPDLVHRSELFARMLNMMATPVDEICQRLLQYSETYLLGRAGHEVADGIFLVISKFSALLDALDEGIGEGRCTSFRGISSSLGAVDLAAQGSLDEQAADSGDMLRLMGVKPCLNTVYARRFLSMLLPQLRRTVILHEPHLLAPIADAQLLELRKALLNHMHSMLRTCAHFSRMSSASLQDLSPGLIELFESEDSQKKEVVLPICASSHGSELLRVCRVSSKVHMLSTKTKPKKLEFEALDGSSHVFLLKGRDDLRLDGRIMQLLRAINTISSSDQCSAWSAAHGPSLSGVPMQLRCRDYDVVPIAPRAGLIRWVSAIPLFAIHKQRRQHLQEQRAEKSGNEEKKSAMESSTDIWHKKMKQHLKASHVDMATTPRKMWPLEALRKTFSEMKADSPADLISRELHLSSLHPAQHFNRCMAYTMSVALTSVIGNLIGLGDRHLDNLLLDLATGEVVHVDYSICFDCGTRLKVPERVPFRLTRCMVAALGPMGVGGVFLQTMEIGLGLLREWRELLLSLIEPCFMHSPVNDWVFPVSTPFRACQASGSLIRRLCKGISEHWQDGSDVANDATQLAEHLEQFAVQLTVLSDAESRHAGLKLYMTKEVEDMLPSKKPQFVEAQLHDLSAFPFLGGQETKESKDREEKDSGGKIGSEAMLAKTLQEMSIEGERFESIRNRAQQELEKFLDKQRGAFACATGLAQPSLESLSGAEGIRVHACAVVTPLTHFRKVLGSSNAKDNKEAVMRSSAMAAARRDLQILPSSIAGLLQQCRQFLLHGSASKAPLVAAAPRPPLGTPPGMPPPGLTPQVLGRPPAGGRIGVIPGGAAGQGLLAPPPTAPPPPPPPPQQTPPEQTPSPSSGRGAEDGPKPGGKELSDGDHITTEADSGDDDESGSDDESSQAEAVDEAAEEEGSLNAAGSASTEEQQLAQDKEEVEEPLRAPVESRSQKSEEINASFDEEDSEEGGPPEKTDLNSTWRAQAIYDVKSISRKIPKSSACLDSHAEALIAAATNEDDLAQMYEGWTAWI